MKKRNHYKNYLFVEFIKNGFENTHYKFIEIDQAVFLCYVQFEILFYNSHKTTMNINTSIIIKKRKKKSSLSSAINVS